MWVIYGSRGFVGAEILKGLTQQGIEVYESKLRLDDTEAVEKELLTLSPKRVVCTVGRTCGGNFKTIDYLESGSHDITKSNVNDNMFSPMALACICFKLNLHLTYIGTGCLFSTPADVSVSDNAKPNFFGSNYSIVKGYTDSLFHLEPFCSTVLNLRIRMPVTADRNPRGFIGKMVGYSQIASIENSITVLPDLIPHMISMISRRIVGTVNCVSPGGVTHDTVLALYRDIVDPSHTWTHFSPEELIAMRSKRSNVVLDTSKLETLCPGVKGTKEALRECMETIRDTQA